jgi:hypothetical protein
MKFRITPLNFASAFFMALAVYIWIYGAQITGIQYQQLHLGGILGGVFLLFAFVVFVIDLMFRNFFPETKKLWIIETSLMVLIVILFLIVKNK